MSKHLPLSVRVPIESDNPGICRDEEACIRCGMQGRVYEYNWGTRYVHTGRNRGYGDLYPLWPVRQCLPDRKYHGGI